MPLTKRQREVAASDTLDFRALRVEFPERLSSSDWREFLNIAGERMLRRIKDPRLISKGLAIVSGDTVWWRRMTRNAPEVRGAKCKILMRFLGDEWLPDRAAFLLSHRQLGLPFPVPKSGRITMNDDRQELIARFREALDLAALNDDQEVPPLVDADVAARIMNDTASQQDYDIAATALKAAPPPKNIRLSATIESVRHHCMEVLKALADTGRVPLALDIHRVIRHAYNAGQEYAKLMAISDSQMLDENKKARWFAGRSPDALTTKLCELIKAYHDKRGRLPTTQELLEQGKFDIDQRHKKVLVDMHGSDEWISITNFRERRRTAIRRLFPGQSPRGRPRKSKG